MKNNSVQFSDTDITIEDVIQIATGEATPELSTAAHWVELMNRSAALVKDVVENHKKVYGITTGFGDSVDVEVNPAKAVELQYNLARFHGCGSGRFFEPHVAKAIMVCRIASLKNGYSGIRLEVLERICELIQRDIVPLIPEEGSVGASGDLTPLSYLAGVLYGERDVLYKGEVRNAGELFAELGIEPVVPGPKETLSLMNGTSAMTAIACFAYDRAAYLTSLSARITALASLGLLADVTHFDDTIFKAKPFPGQRRVAAIIREDYGEKNYSYRIQAPYSIRCAPHIIGVLADSLPWLRTFIETELNSANDNPLVDNERERFLHTGNFYGGHIAFAMDSMKNGVGNIADLLDRQFALLADFKTNNGLPKNLTGAADKSINHGFKAIQIAVSSWTAEALQKTMPLTSFSRSTECHNQDKVSMGTIAARDCMRVLELTEQVAAASLFAFTQAVTLRLEAGEICKESLPKHCVTLLDEVLAVTGVLREDRPTDKVLKALVEKVRNQEFFAPELSGVDA